MDSDFRTSQVSIYCTEHCTVHISIQTLCKENADLFSIVSSSVSHLSAIDEVQRGTTIDCSETLPQPMICHSKKKKHLVCNTSKKRWGSTLESRLETKHAQGVNKGSKSICSLLNPWIRDQLWCLFALKQVDSPNLTKSHSHRWASTREPEFSDSAQLRINPDCLAWEQIEFGWGIPLIRPIFNSTEH